MRVSWAALRKNLGCWAGVTLVVFGMALEFAQGLQIPLGPGWNGTCWLILGRRWILCEMVDMALGCVGAVGGFGVS